MSRTCEYIGRAGVCGRGCYEGRCYIHRKSVSHEPCRAGCGNFTKSRTHYCNRCGNGVGGHQKAELQLLKRHDKKDAAAMEALNRSLHELVYGESSEAEQK